MANQHKVVYNRLDEWVSVDETSRSYSCNQFVDSNDALEITLNQKFLYDDLDYHRTVSRTLSLTDNNSDFALSDLNACIDAIGLVITKASEVVRKYEESMKPTRVLEKARFPFGRQLSESMELLESIERIQHFPYYSLEVEKLRKIVHEAEKKVDEFLQFHDQAIRNRLDDILGVKSVDIKNTVTDNS